MNARKEQLLLDIAAIDAKLAIGDPKLKASYQALRAKKQAEVDRIDADYAATAPAVDPSPAPAPTPAPAAPVAPATQVPDALGPDEVL